MPRVKNCSRRGGKAPRPGKALRSTGQYPSTIFDDDSVERAENIQSVTEALTGLQQVTDFAQMDLTVNELEAIKQLVNVEGTEYPIEPLGYVKVDDTTWGVAVAYNFIHILPMGNVMLDMNRDVPSFTMERVKSFGFPVYTQKELEEETRKTLAIILREQKRGQKYYCCPYCDSMPSFGRRDLVLKHMTTQRPDGEYRCPARKEGMTLYEPRELDYEIWFTKYYGYAPPSKRCGPGGRGRRSTTD